MNWIYLSPHFDDVTLSCGGLLWEQSQAGDSVQVWTIAAGEPEGELSPFAASLHARWQTDNNAPAQRRLEDHRSCQILGAEPLSFSLPDCIYRRAPDGRFFYASEESLWGEVDLGEESLIQALSRSLQARLPAQAELVCPLALGGHVDHRLTRQAAERIGRPLWYYADYPYVLQEAQSLTRLRRTGWEGIRHPVRPAGVRAWIEAVAAHASQISTFWKDRPAMEAAVQNYCDQMGGVQLWRYKDREISPT